MPALTSDWNHFIARELERRREAQSLRTVRAFRRDGVFRITSDGTRLLDLSSNDYLGLSVHPAVSEGAARALRRGSGTGASRLIVGTDPGARELEERLAEFHCRDRALVFGSGYLANVGIIPSLVGRNDAVFSDRLNHASITDGCLLSRAAHVRYRHNDVDELEALLLDSQKRGTGRKLIVTESIFSMNGDRAPLRELIELKERFNAALMVDEAHAVGVLGAHGEGYAAELGVDQQVDIHVGTFGKAFGAYGAYVAGDRSLIEYLENSCRTFIYTTALPPSVVGSIDAALDLLRDGDQARNRLAELASRIRTRLRSDSIDIGESTSHIIPIMIGKNDRALAASAALESAGILAIAIRPPTVPQGTARLRLSLCALLSDSDVDRATSAIASAVGPPADDIGTD